MFTKVEVWSVASTQNGMAVLLKIPYSVQCVPVYLEDSEAEEIIAAISGINKTPFNAPQLLSTFAGTAGINLNSVKILSNPDSGSYRALINFHHKNEHITIEAAVPLSLSFAVYSKIPVLLDTSIVETTAISFAFNNSAMPISVQLAQLQGELDRSVQSEEYEQAASIRDRIKLLEEKTRSNIE